MQRSQKMYLWRFFNSNKNAVMLLIVLIFFQALFEAVLPVWGKEYVRDSSALLDKDGIAITMAIFTAVLIIYFIVAYFSIKASRQLLVNLINRFREDWFRNYMEGSTGNRKQSIFITKITYHFSLIQMGFTQTIVNLIYIVIMIGILAAFLPHVVSYAHILLLFFICLYVGIIFLGRFVAFKYISKEQTLSTHIIQHAVETMNNMPFMRMHNLQHQSLQKLQKLVELDSYFRVRRGTWMSFANRILFGIILLFLGIFYIISIYYPSFTAGFYNDVVVSSIIFALFIRLMYSSLNIGLFSVPLMLGLKLSIPVKKKNIHKRKSLDFTNLIFRAKKVQLDKGFGYRKNVQLQFNKAERIAIQMKNQQEADVLTRIIRGKAGKKGAPWMIIIDGERHTYADWTHSCASPYYIDPNFNVNATVGEIISGKDKSQIDENTISDMLNTFQDHPSFEFIFNMKKRIATEYNDSTFSFSKKGLLQIAHAVFNQPEFIVIDNVWMQINRLEILDALDLLFLKAPQSTIVTIVPRDRSNIPEKLNFRLLSL